MSPDIDSRLAAAATAKGSSDATVAERLFLAFLKGREGRREMLLQVGHEFLGGPVGSSGSWKQVGMGPVVCSGVKMPLFTLLPLLVFEVQPD